MRKFTYILSLLFVMALMFTGCTKLDVIDPAGDVEQHDYRDLDGDDMDGDGDASTDCGDDDEEDDGGGITDEDDDEDEDDSDSQRGSTTSI